MLLSEALGMFFTNLCEISLMDATRSDELPDGTAEGAWGI